MGVHKKMRYIVSALLLASVLVMSLTPEEKAKVEFGEIFNLWREGKFSEAKERLERILYKPIDVEDIPKFWYLRARIDIDLGMIDEALRSLQSVLVVDPTNVEVLSLIKEIEYLTGRRDFNRNYKLKEFKTIKGFKNSVEYFYTIDDFAVFGEKIYMIDRANSRLLIYEDFKLVDALDLPFEPLSLEVSPSGIPYVSSVEGAVYSIGGVITEVASGLKTPILAGFDRFGNLWGVSGFSVFELRSSELVVKEIPWGRPVIIDAEMTKDGLWILDVMHRRLALIDPYTLKIEKDIPTFIDIRAFEVIPYGNFLVLTADGNLLEMDEKQNVENLRVDCRDVVAVEYEYPVLMMADWREHVVRIYTFAGDEPIIVKIDSMDIGGGNAKLSVRFETLYGDPVEMADRFAFVSVDGGRVSFEISHTLDPVDEYISDVDFVSDKVFSVPRGKGFDVFIPVDSNPLKGVEVTLRDKSVRVFSYEKPRDHDLDRIILMSGGAFGEREVVFPFRQRWEVKVSYPTSVSVKIVPITVGIALGGQVYSDTIYVVERGVIGGG